MAAFNRQPSPFATPSDGSAVPRPPTMPGSTGAGTNQVVRTPPAGGGAAQPRPPGTSASAQGPYSGSPNPGRSGSDPRGRVQNQGNYQQQRFEGQMDPLMNQFATNYGRGAEQGFLDYGRTMGKYNDVASQYGKVGDQFAQLAGPQGYGAFSETGGYSPQDMASMRSRGVSPIRAAYSNAEREVGRQRSLQGGYSPNATATLAKMAREQGQAGSDAAGNVEAQLAQMKQQGKLAGLAGQTSAMQGQLGAAGGQLGAAGGQAGLYGATPGMASTFGNQVSGAVGTSGQFGLDLMGRDIAAQQLPGQWDTTMGKIGDVATMAGNLAYPWLNRQQQAPVPSAGPAQVPVPPSETPEIFGTNSPGDFVPGSRNYRTPPGTMPQSTFNWQQPPAYSGAGTQPPIAGRSTFDMGNGQYNPPPQAGPYQSGFGGGNGQYGLGQTRQLQGPLANYGRLQGGR